MFALLTSWMLPATLSIAVTSRCSAQSGRGFSTIASSFYNLLLEAMKSVSQIGITTPASRMSVVQALYNFVLAIETWASFDPIVARQVKFFDSLSACKRFDDSRQSHIHSPRGSARRLRPQLVSDCGPVIVNIQRHILTSSNSELVSCWYSSVCRKVPNNP